MSTDTTFALDVLALLDTRVPVSLKLCLMASLPARCQASPSMRLAGAGLELQRLRDETMASHINAWAPANHAHKKPQPVTRLGFCLPAALPLSG
ncbi:hypothetical protein [Pseudomonas sp. EYE_354]|uniref:hypothetical protein n=1 Tax=Pseudomonas sp. EYE_354 TaxID=2853449 RepID=UPI0020042672|nr:hypothetical protein [Pseudomonas sp. EYE_354]MCK6190900.1 hypothetical protein [Pseudomonas sp. EYE_354]